MTAPLRRRALVELAFVALFAALSCAMTWPWVARVADAVPDRGDPYLLSWVLAWDFHQIFRAPLRLFDANLFYPLRHSLAFSNDLLGVFLPLFWLPLLGLGPVAVYNVSALTGFAFTGYAVFRLARTVTDCPRAAILGSLAFTFLPGRFLHDGHLQLLWAGWAALLLESAILFFRSPTRGRAFWMGAWFVLNALTDVYWLLLTLVPIAATCAILAHARAAGKKTLLRAGSAFFLASVALLPFLLPYERAARENGFERSAGENHYMSAVPEDWLAVNPAVRLYRNVLTRRPPSGERALFPGFGILLLAAAALVPRRPAERAAPSPPDKRMDTAVRLLDAAAIASACAAALAFAFWPGEGTTSVRHASTALLAGAAAFGVRLWLRLPRFPGGAARGGWRDVLRTTPRPELHVAGAWVVLGFLDSLGMNTPYHRLLWKFVLPYRAMRVPARAEFVAALGLCLLAAAGARRWLQATRRPAALFTLLGVALLAELRVAPIALLPAEVEVPGVYRWLARTPMTGGVVELPMGFGSHNFLYTLRAADHWRPLVDGTSGFQPAFERRLEEASERDPIPAGWMAELEAVPVSFLVVHRATLSPPEASALDVFLKSESRENRLRFVARFPAAGPEDEVYAVVKTEPRILSRTPSSAPR